MDEYLNGYITEIIGEVNELNANQIDKNMVDLIVEYFDSAKAEEPLFAPSFGCCGPIGINGYYGDKYCCEFCTYKCNTNQELVDHKIICLEYQIPCPHCNIPIKRRLLGEHKKNCDFRPITCSYCQVEYGLAKWVNHYNNCSGLFFSKVKNGYYPIGLKVSHDQNCYK